MLRVLKVAGRIAYNPPGWDEAVGKDLTDEEKFVLANERKQKLWQQTKAFKLTVVVVWLSAMIQGWIQSTLNGANLTWAEQLGVQGVSTSMPALYRQAGSNASVYLVAAGACWLSDPLQSKLLDRRGVIFVAAVLCFSAGIGAACTQHWTQLLGCRIIMGIAMGLKASVSTLLLVEGSTCHLR